MIEAIPQKRKMGEINMIKQTTPPKLTLEYIYESSKFKPTPIPTEQKTKKRKLNDDGLGTWTPDFAPTKKKTRRRKINKQSKTSKIAGGYKGSTDQGKKVCEYCGQQSTLSVHGRYYLCNSKTQPGLKICNACKSWEYRNGNLVPRDQRRKAYHSRIKSRRPVQRYYDPAKPTMGTSVEVFTDSDTDSVDFTTLALNDSPDIQPVGQTSQFEGVSWDPTNGKWKAEYGKGSEFHVVGLFDLEIDAANAYASTVASRAQQPNLNLIEIIDTELPTAYDCYYRFETSNSSLPFIKEPHIEFRICQYCKDPSKNGVVHLSGMSKLHLCIDCYQFEALNSKLVPKSQR